VFIVVVYFVIDSVRKLLDTPSYSHNWLPVFFRVKGQGAIIMRLFKVLLHEAEIIFVLDIVSNSERNRNHMELGQLSQYSEYCTGWTTGIRLPAAAVTFFLHYHVKNGSGAHPASCPIGFLGVRAAGV
jgi:hypothetical protein